MIRRAIFVTRSRATEFMLGSREWRDQPSSPYREEMGVLAPHANRLTPTPLPGPPYKRGGKPALCSSNDPDSALAAQATARIEGRACPRLAQKRLKLVHS
jgi:hypothetical protein